MARVRLNLPTTFEFGSEVPILPLESAFVQLIRRDLKSVSSLSLVLFINDKPVYMKAERHAPFPQGKQVCQRIWVRAHTPERLMYVFEHLSERWTLYLRPL